MLVETTTTATPNSLSARNWPAARNDFWFLGLAVSTLSKSCFGAHGGASKSLPHWTKFSSISFSVFSSHLLEAPKGKWRPLPKRLTPFRKEHYQIFDEVSEDFPVVADGF